MRWRWREGAAPHKCEASATHLQHGGRVELKDAHVELGRVLEDDRDDHLIAGSKVALRVTPELHLHLVQDVL